MSGQVIVHCPTEQRWRRFADPIEIVSARSVAEVIPALRLIEAQVHTRRLYAAGYLAYEAAPAFDAALHVRSASTLPLLWFGLYEQAEPIELPAHDESADPIEPWRPTVTWDEYTRAIDAIKDHIAAGRTYQVNYTYRLRAAFAGDAWQFFLHLARRKATMLLISISIAICSASPELFFQLNGKTVIRS
jgi:para-aminobenzoate synthetase/4-amino-4-deoxychorismate lyase